MKTLKQYRVDRLLSLEKLAKKARVNRASVKRAESGAPIRLLTFVAICKALEVSTDDVTGVQIYQEEA